MKPQLIGIDVDGTLTDASLKISDRVKAAVSAAQADGVTVSLITGRMFRASQRFIEALALHGPIVCYQGAAVYSTETGERIQHTPVDTGIAIELVRLGKADGTHVQCYFDDQFYVESVNKYSEIYSKLSGLDPVVVPSLEAELDKGRQSTKIVFVLDSDKADGYLQKLEGLLGDRGYVTRSTKEFVEVVNPHVDKGTALRFLAEHGKIPIEATMGIGDAWNDVPLLRAAGTRIAMGTAPPELRAVATAVVGDVAHDGVAEAIERFVLA